MPISLAEKLPEYTRYADVPPCYDPDQALKDFKALTPEQITNLGTGIAQAASSDEAIEQFANASAAASTAVQNIDNMFITLTARLIGLGNAQQFLDPFALIKETFRDVVKASRELAVSISHYAGSFDTIVIEFCADVTLTVEDRKKYIQGFLDTADRIIKEAGNMNDRFERLKDTFATFVGSFADWARDKEEEDQQKIKVLCDDISQLNDQISAMDTAMMTISLTLGATLPITGTVAAFFPVAAPFIMAAGLAIGGIQLGTLTGLTIAKNNLLKKKSDDENAIKDLQDEISKIKAARTQLENDGQVDLLIFTNNVSAIQRVWTNVVGDAKDIKLWLNDGANIADQPIYMKQNLEEGAKVYSKMAKYLKDYADGVIKTVETFDNY